MKTTANYHIDSQKLIDFLLNENPSLLDYIEVKYFLKNPKPKSGQLLTNSEIDKHHLKYVFNIN